MFFEKCLFPVIDKLACDDGPLHEFAPVTQGKKSVPHQDAKLHKYIVNFCKEKQWMWEPQGPHMPHMSVLDLSVFPVMPLYNIHLIPYLRGMRVSKEVDIWKVTAKVWNKLQS